MISQFQRVFDTVHSVEIFKVAKASHRTRHPFAISFLGILAAVVVFVSRGEPDEVAGFAHTVWFGSERNRLL